MEINEHEVRFRRTEGGTTRVVVDGKYAFDVRHVSSGNWGRSATWQATRKGARPVDHPLAGRWAQGDILATDSTRQRTITRAIARLDKETT